MSIHSVECNVGTNPITIETGKMARLADGAVVVRSGDTVVLVTVVSATKVKEGQTFFPCPWNTRKRPLPRACSPAVTSSVKAAPRKRKS